MLASGGGGRRIKTRDSAMIGRSQPREHSHGGYHRVENTRHRAPLHRELVTEQGYLFNFYLPGT